MSERAALLSTVCAVGVLATACAQEPHTPGGGGWSSSRIDFGATSWRPICGQWRITDGEYVQRDALANPAYSFAAHAIVSDFEYSVRFRVERTGRAMNAGLVFRATDSGHFYYAQIGVRHRQVILVRADPKAQWNEIARKRDLELVPGRWHEVRVQAVADRIRIALDGKWVLEARDSALAAGCVGLRTGLAAVRFADPKLIGKVVKLQKEWSVMQTDWTPDDLPRLEGGERIIAASGEVGAGMFPKVLLLPDGELVALVRGGAPHISRGGRIDLIRSGDGGQTWSKPVALPKTSDDDRGPSIGRAPDGTLVCMYRIFDAYDENGVFRKKDFDQYTMLTLSHDRGRTWTKPVEAKLPPHPWVAPFQRMVCLDDGTMLMPAYTGQEALVIRSHAGGRNWGDISTIRQGFNEYAFLLLPGGRLLAAMRHRQSGLWISSSADGGREWSEPEQITEGSRFPADLVLLPSGHVLLVYGRRHPPQGVECRLSTDAGTTWGAPLLLAWSATNNDCGYPSAVVLDDGTIVMLWYAIGSTTDEQLGWHCEAVRFREEDVVSSLAKGRAGE